MFDKLVVSTLQKRRTRTAKFFVGTSIVYLSIAALAVFGSIFFASPKLADTSSPVPGITFLPIGGPKEASKKPQKPVVARPNDPRSVLPLDRIVSNLGNQRTQIVARTIPGPVEFDGRETPLGAGGGEIPGIPGLPGRNGSSGTVISDPPRIDPPKPAPRSVETDNKPVRVTSIVLQGKVIERRVPVYPELARRIRLQGDVAVEVIISPEGRVESVRAVSGHPMLIQPALDAARVWRFGPTFLNNVPVRVTGVITFVFKLSE